MRIAMVSEHADPLAAPGSEDTGGQNVHVGALACALAAQGHEVTVHTRRGDPGDPEHERMVPGVTVHRVAAGPPRPVAKDDLLEHVPALGEGLARAWRAEPPDVVHAHFWMSGLAALPVARELGVPMVQTFHALGVVKRRHQGEQDTSPPERLGAEAHLAAAADRVLATCRDEADELTAMGAPAHRIEIVPCGVDPTEFAPGRAAPRRRGRARLLVVGRLVPRKGTDTVVRALELLEDAELVVAGGPPPPALHADPEAGRLRALAERLGVADRLHLQGPVAHHQVPELIRSADVVACVPDYEPFGMVALEAMACGVPVVASRVGGLADTVRDGLTGRLVPPRSPRALADAVAELSGPGVRDRVGAAGRRRVLDEYTWSRVAASTAEVYRALAGTRGLAARPVVSLGSAG